MQHFLNRFGARWAEQFTEQIPLIPVVSYAVFSRYALMIHNTLTGQSLGLESVRGEAFAPAEEPAGSRPLPDPRDRT
ncbi:MAG: hypothetical protein ILP12_05725, partial [Lachnospiraceae bacterium]|nr:hypothetical protein [Lachnospiraceae bacterium]